MQTISRDPATFEELLVHIRKAIGSQQRRPQSMSATELLGPGFAVRAIQIGNWNDPLTLVNGNFYSEPGALHSPDSGLTWTGSTIAKANGSGMQQVWNTDDLDDVHYWMRTFVADSSRQGANFSDWRNFATPTGYVEFGNIDPAYTTSVQDQLDAAAAAIVGILPPLKVYRQTTAPTNPDSDARGLQVGDQWLDTDDNEHAYIWDGTTWQDYAAYVLGDIQSQIDAATATAEGAASDAADALGLTVTLTKVYRQTTGPSNPDTGGRALVTNDVWFDSDDDNRAYYWTGSAWAEIGLATESYADTQATAAQVAAIAAAAADATTKAGAAQSAAISAAASDATTKAANALASANTYYDTNIVTITGSLIQTTATANRGIKITTGGLTAYDGSGGARLVITASTGAITMVGSLTAGSTITGAAIVGGSIKTNATTSRGVEITSGGITAFSTSGVAQFTVDGATGAVTLAGPLTGAGTITGPTFQTSSLANTGIKISSAGLIGYNGTSAVFTLNNSTGAVILTGAISTGSTIDGSVVTGGTVQTTATATAGIKITSTGMVAYDGANTAKFTVSASTGDVILAGNMTGGGAITGPIFQTTATAARGVKITSSGLVGYDGSGVSNIIVDASTGNVTIKGGLTTGSTIDGATVTGGTFQTSSSALTGIKITSTGLVAYGSGVAKLTIDASTGSLTLDGTLTGGGTITGPTFQAGTSGNARLVIRSSGTSGVIEFYSGLSGETPGRIYSDLTGGIVNPELVLETGQTATKTERSRVTLISGAPNLSSATHEAFQFIFVQPGVSGTGVAGAAFVVGPTTTVSLQGVGQGAGFDTTQNVISGGNMAVTSTHTDIPGLSQSVTSPGTSAVWIVTFTGWLLCGNAAWTTLVELNVSGTGGGTQSANAVASGQTTGGTFTQTWRITGLSAGSHTFKCAAFTDGAGRTGTVAATHSSMTIQRAA